MYALVVLDVLSTIHGRHVRTWKVVGGHFGYRIATMVASVAHTLSARQNHQACVNLIFLMVGNVGLKELK